jgi:hypothetical protein
MRPLHADATFHERLLSRGIQCRESYYAWVGHGEHALAAWETFRQVALEPLDQLDLAFGDERCRISTDTLSVTAWVGEQRPAKGWRSLGEPAEPAAFILQFQRLFGFDNANGDYLGMNALQLDIEFAATAALEGLAVNGIATPDDSDARDGNEPGSDETRRSTMASELIEAVQASEAFRLAFSGPAICFYFQQSDI